MSSPPDPPGAESGGASALAGYPVTAPALSGPVTFEQRWDDLTFVHWPVRPASVEGLYPPGIRPDVFADGMTYVSLIPFVLSSTKVSTTLPVPFFGRFAETNVRLYSIDADGRHGVFFRSLETARLAVVPAMRICPGVPYTWAKMRVTRLGDQITYGSVRRWPRRGGCPRLGRDQVGEGGRSDAHQRVPVGVTRSRPGSRAPGGHPARGGRN